MENKEELLKHFEELKAKNIKIDATRGKPARDQLDLSLDMLDVLNSKSSFFYDNLDARNYGCLDGLGIAKEFVADILDVKPENVFVCGNSALNIMYDLISKSFSFGVCGSKRWCDQHVKWLCVVPGYDRHFAITERFGFELVNVPMLDGGPDMDLVEKLIKDPEVKGIWCVPKFSNPDGTCYSDEVVRRFARLKPASEDFRVYWDNAYIVHDFDFDNPVKLLNIFDEAKACGTEDMFYEFISFSKISFAGDGIAAVAASKNNIEDIKKSFFYQTIGYDKINQLRHVLYFKNKQGVIDQMRKHADIIRPKFEYLHNYFTKEISDVCSWVKPKGGYFICLKVNKCAKEVIAKCAECGVKLTAAGCSSPYHNDIDNEFIRIAPSTMNMCDLETFADVVCTAIKILSL
ncbi:MAG: aminotransferase [Bacilli bacterium]|nr:aminotransferase [Bacilli bacterium]